LVESNVAKSTVDLQSVLKLSTLINENSPEGYKESFAYSFTSILLAFMISEDQISRWFQKFVEAGRIEVNNILREKGIGKEKWEEIIGNKSAIPSMKLNAWTSSARTIFTIAEEYLSELENKAISSKSRATSTRQNLDVRHIIGAYIYGNHGHEQQMRSWGFHTDLLSKGFIHELSVLKIGLYEVEYWTGRHATKFGETIPIRK
jgi:hypothetical protein